MWKQPPVIKIYEALGAVADGRIVSDGNHAKCYSSSGNKFYEVTYDHEANAIMTNDNGSYWKGYLGYPAIAYLLQSGVLEYKPNLANLLKGVAWKDLNTKFKNDFDKTLSSIVEKIDTKEREQLERYVQGLSKDIAKRKFTVLGKRKLPPKGY